MGAYSFASARVMANKASYPAIAATFFASVRVVPVVTMSSIKTISLCFAPLKAKFLGFCLLNSKDVPA